MGRQFFTSIPHNGRALYHLRYRIAFVLFIFALFQQQHLYLVSRQSLTAKYSPTDFKIHSGDLHPRLSRPNDEVSQFQDEFVANRAAWKALGKGCEGKVFAYKDSVIKTFTPTRSPFRNCAPDATTTWPTEIPASLRFGGFDKPVDVSDTNASYDGFLPVKAYFMASTTPGEPAEWHLVTPLLKGSNLNTLAKQLSANETPKSFREVDAISRPAFNRLLKNMESLHASGYCHDDINPANIFVQDESYWILGDLGNVREVSHPFHASKMWKDNAQLEDCRANDVVRALQSYLKFVQSSASNPDEFNAAFYEGVEPMSRLFWWTLADARSMSAEELRRRSVIEYPEATHKTKIEDGGFKPTRPHTFMSLFSGKLAVRRAVNQALEIRMPDWSARFYGMVWLFGVPDAHVCGV
jgi:tRNA A-37 threonylcarbamoyl transferase component Bud32